jgi:hypothetical protein
LSTKIPWWAWIVGAYVLPEIYERLSPETKQKIKSIFPIHHGTLGETVAIGGALTGNVPAVLVGGTWMYHDRKDAPYWEQDIERIKQSVNAKINEILIKLSQNRV